MRPCSSMIAGQPWRGSTSIRSMRRSASGVGCRPPDAAGAAAAAAGAAEAAAADVLGDVRGGDSVAAGDPGAGHVAAGMAAVVTEVRAGAAVERIVVAVAVRDDAVVAVDAVGGVVATARREGEREHGDGHEGHVARAVATAFAHSASSFCSVWMRRSVSTTSGCETFARSLSNS